MSPAAATAPRVVFAGAAVADAIALVPRFPEPDDRVLAQDLVAAGGGPAATAAVAAARLGIPVAFVGAVGDDEDGERIVAGLCAEHVDVSGVTVVPASRSARSVVVVDVGRGTRAICTRPGPELALNAAAREALAAAEWAHLDHVGWPAVQAILDGWSRVPQLSVDGGNPVDGAPLRDVALFVPTATELARRYGAHADVAARLRAAAADGPDLVVATLGARGCMAGTPDGAQWAAPALDTEVLSTVGAGDVFHGALLAALLRELPLPDCLRYANAAAALSCRGLDGRSAAPDHDEVLRALAATAATEGEQ